MVKLQLTAALILVLFGAIGAFSLASLVEIFDKGPLKSVWYSLAPWVS
jgi:hypothetical protein